MRSSRTRGTTHEQPQKGSKKAGMNNVITDNPRKPRAQEAEKAERPGEKGRHPGKTLNPGDGSEKRATYIQASGKQWKHKNSQLLLRPKPRNPNFTKQQQTLGSLTKPAPNNLQYYDGILHDDINIDTCSVPITLTDEKSVRKMKSILAKTSIHYFTILLPP